MTAQHIIIAVSALGGIIGGMGMGGGTLLIPLLTLLLGVDQHAAQAINLIAFVPMAAVALALHIKNKLVDFKGILWIVLPGAAFAAVFGYIARNVDGEILRKIFGGFLVILSLVQFFSGKIAAAAEKGGKNKG